MADLSAEEVDYVEDFHDSEYDDDDFESDLGSARKEKPSPVFVPTAPPTNTTPITRSPRVSGKHTVLKSFESDFSLDSRKDEFVSSSSEHGGITRLPGPAPDVLRKSSWDDSEEESEGGHESVKSKSSSSSGGAPPGVVRTMTESSRISSGKGDGVDDTDQSLAGGGPVSVASGGLAQGSRPKHGRKLSLVQENDGSDEGSEKVKEVKIQPPQTTAEWVAEASGAVEGVTGTGELGSDSDGGDPAYADTDEDNSTEDLKRHPTGLSSDEPVGYQNSESLSLSASGEKQREIAADRAIPSLKALSTLDPFSESDGEALTDRNLGSTQHSDTKMGPFVPPLALDKELTSASENRRYQWPSQESSKSQVGHESPAVHSASNDTGSGSARSFVEIQTGGDIAMDRKNDDEPEIVQHAMSLGRDGGFLERNDETNVHVEYREQKWSKDPYLSSRYKYETPRGKDVDREASVLASYFEEGTQQSANLRSMRDYYDHAYEPSKIGVRDIHTDKNVRNHVVQNQFEDAILSLILTCMVSEGPSNRHTDTRAYTSDFGSPTTYGAKESPKTHSLGDPVSRTMDTYEFAHFLESTKREVEKELVVEDAYAISDDDDDEPLSSFYKSTVRPLREPHHVQGNAGQKSPDMFSELLEEMPADRYMFTEMARLKRLIYFGYQQRSAPKPEHVIDNALKETVAELLQDEAIMKKIQETVYKKICGDTSLKQERHPSPLRSMPGNRHRVTAPPQKAKLFWR